MRDDLLGVLPGELLKLLIAGEGRLASGELVAGHIAIEVAALFPALQLAAGAVAAVAQNAELAAFHAWDWGDLVEE